MFDIDSSAGVEVRDAILRRLSMPTMHPNCRCSPVTEELYVNKVIYNGPATVVYWSDKTRTVVKCQSDDYFDPELGFLLAVCKKVCGNTGKYNELLRKHVPGYGESIAIAQMREELTKFCKSRPLCSECPLSQDGYNCGRGFFFDFPEGRDGYMTDESIVRHYRAMKGAKHE